MKTSETKDTFSDIDEKKINPPFVLGSTERQELERYNPLRADTVIKYLWHYNSNPYIINYSNIRIVSSLDALKQALNQLQEDANIQKSNVLIFLVDQLTHSFSEKVINQHYTALIFRCDETNNIQWNYIDPLGHGIRKSMAKAIRSSYKEDTTITSYKGKIQYVIEQENIYLGNTYDNGTFLIFLVTQLLKNQELYNIEEWCNNNEYFDIKEPETKVKLSRYLGKAIRKTLLLEDGKDSPDIESLLSVTDIPTIFNAEDPKHLYDLLKIGAKIDLQNEYGEDIYSCLSLDQVNIIRNYTLRLQSTAELLSKTKENKDKEIKIEIQKDNSIQLLKGQIDLLKNKKFIKEAECKVKNNEWYKDWYKDVHGILNQMRTNYESSYDSYKKEQVSLWLTDQISKLIKDLFLQSDNPEIMGGVQWVLSNKNQIINSFVNDSWDDLNPSNELQNFIEMLGIPNLEDYLKTWVNDEICKNINILQNQYYESYDKLFSNLNSLERPIVWGMPEVIRTINGFQDSFVYQGSTIEKTVYIPFTSIHKKLTESNWIMRAGIDNTKNYLLAHIGFIVSDKPHNPEQCFYSGGRVHIDFPMVQDLSILSQVQYFTNADFQNFAESSCCLGKYPIYTAKHHTEVGLINFLKEKVENIVSVLKCKLSYKYGSYVGHKVYAVTLFINSQKNVCGGNYDHSNCEGVLNKLMKAHEPDSFLGKLKKQLNENMLKTLTVSNEQFPYMFISVSAHEYYEYYCHATLKENAKDALLNRPQIEQYRNLNIDIKQLAGKIILSSAEVWLAGKTAEVRSEQIKKSFQDEHNGPKIPFYSGCKSGENSPEDLISKFLGEEKLENPEYDIPICLDGIDIFTIVNQYDDDTILEHTMSYFQRMTLGDSSDSE